MMSKRYHNKIQYLNINGQAAGLNNCLQVK